MIDSSGPLSVVLADPRGPGLFLRVKSLKVRTTVPGVKPTETTVVIVGPERPMKINRRNLVAGTERI
jgi:hypothetical protein